MFVNNFLIKDHFLSVNSYKLIVDYAKNRKQIYDDLVQLISHYYHDFVVLH